MGTRGGPNIRIPNLVLSIDPKNIESYQTDDPNILNPKVWTEGTGGVTGFVRNGVDSENHRIIDEDPFGNDAVLWEARPDSNSGADGGWNSNRFSIDNTKLYRFSTWVKRTVYDDGRFYFGTRGYGSTNGVLRRDNGNNTTNPYFWISSDPPTTSELPNSTWVLVVGHVWPAGSGIGSNHVDSGRYTISQGKYANITRDYIWRSETTQTLHRSYLYYSSQTTPRQQWVYPRVDVVDGSEPSIDDLLNNKVNDVNLIDRSGNNNDGVFINNPTVNQVDGYTETNGTDSYISISTDIINDIGSNDEGTLEFWFRTTNQGHLVSAWTDIDNYFTIITGDSTGLWSDESIRIIYRSSGIYYYNYAERKGNNFYVDNQWHHCVFTIDSTGNKLYMNGELTTVEQWSTSTEGLSSTRWLNELNPSNFTIGRRISNYTSLKCSLFNVYNKSLSSSEVVNNYNSLKSRFGL